MLQRAGRHAGRGTLRITTRTAVRGSTRRGRTRAVPADLCDGRGGRQRRRASPEPATRWCSSRSSPPRRRVRAAAWAWRWSGRPTCAHGGAGRVHEQPRRHGVPPAVPAGRPLISRLATAASPEDGAGAQRCGQPGRTRPRARRAGTGITKTATAQVARARPAQGAGARAREAAAGHGGVDDQDGHELGQRNRHRHGGHSRQLRAFTDGNVSTAPNRTHLPIPTSESGTRFRRRCYPPAFQPGRSTGGHGSTMSSSGIATSASRPAPALAFLRRGRMS